MTRCFRKSPDDAKFNLSLVGLKRPDRVWGGRGRGGAGSDWDRAVQKELMGLETNMYGAY